MGEFSLTKIYENILPIVNDVIQAPINNLIGFEITYIDRDGNEQLIKATIKRESRIVGRDIVKNEFTTLKREDLKKLADLIMIMYEDTEAETIPFRFPV